MKNIVNIYWEVKTETGSKVKINNIGKLNTCLTEGKVPVSYYGLAGRGWMEIEERIVEVTRVTIKKTKTEKKVFEFAKENK